MKRLRSLLNRFKFCLALPFYHMGQVCMYFAVVIGRDAIVMYSVNGLIRTMNELCDSGQNRGVMSPPDRFHIPQKESGDSVPEETPHGVPGSSRYDWVGEGGGHDPESVGHDSKLVAPEPKPKDESGNIH